MHRSALIGLILLAACSPARQPAPTPTTQPMQDPMQDGAPRATTAPPARNATNLRGEVSPLSGTISDFKVTVSGLQTIVELPADILFAFDSADLTAAARSPLKRTADLIAQGARGDIRIVGHTDSKGDVDYNIGLSNRRARAVGDWLATNGVTAARLKPEGRGEADPIAPNEGASGVDNPKGRALNRRVMIYIPR
jgi:outer membrane protein OmpA-like peptidoglycan-associated protein